MKLVKSNVKGKESPDSFKIFNTTGHCFLEVPAHHVIQGNLWIMIVNKGNLCSESAKFVQLSLYTGKQMKGDNFYWYEIWLFRECL